MHNNNSSLTDRGLRGGLIAALVVFALTWFVVNGAELPQDEIGAANTRDRSLCAVPSDKPTSRFLNVPVRAPVPWYGG
jgi:hypothetical protein